MAMNMSYCRFENTLAALYECLDALQEGKELSESEENAKEELVHLCKEIYDEYRD